MRRPLAQVSYQALLPVSLRAQLQNLLLPKEIEGQRAGDQERKIFGRFAFQVSGIVLKNQRVADLVKAHEFILRARVGAMLAVIEKVNIALEELVVRVSIGID